MTMKDKAGSRAPFIVYMRVEELDEHGNYQGHPDYLNSPGFDTLEEAMEFCHGDENEWKRERDQLLDMTMQLDEHPEGYEGPCLCKTCQANAV